MMGSDGAEIDRLIGEKKAVNVSPKRRRNTETVRDRMRSVSPISRASASPIEPDSGSSLGGVNLSGSETEIPQLKRMGSLNALPPLTKANGIIHYALQSLFAFMAENTDKKYNVVCSYLEIYNEMVFDLLTDRNKLKQETLMICEDP
jgi:hypothetical protein